MIRLYLDEVRNPPDDGGGAWTFRRAAHPRWVEPTKSDPIARMWWGDLLEEKRRRNDVGRSMIERHWRER